MSNSTFRIKYINSWKEEKTLTMEGEYWTVRADAFMFFGEKNVISIEDLNPSPVPRQEFREDDEYYEYD